MFVFSLESAHVVDYAVVATDGFVIAVYIVDIQFLTNLKSS